jgi:hypothetical protein
MGQPEQPSREYEFRRRRRRFPVKTTIAIVVLLLLLVGADRVGAAITENAMASQVQTSMTLSGKPSVSVQGFPFLTQLAASDLSNVVITGHNLTDGQLDLASINVTAHNIHIHGTSSATIDSLNGSVTVTLSSIANAGNVPAGIALTPDGPNMVKATINILGFDTTATARVSQQGANGIHVQVIDAGGVPASALGSFADFTVTVPKLPSGVSISSVNVTGAGVQVDFTGTDTTFSK